MPELPDLTVYVERLRAKVLGRAVRRVRVASPFVLRTAVPRICEAEGHAVTAVERVGKRIALGLDNGWWLVVHLMIAGRLRWLPLGGKAGARITLASLEFDHGQLVLTEAGTQRRASLHLLPDGDALRAMDAGGIEVATCTPAAFAARLRAESHTLKRALTDPRLFSGIGNAYSDEILHRARLSPVALTRSLDDEACGRLLDAARKVLAEWTERLRAEAGDWPQQVTAFRPGMAVHGRFGQACPACGTPVQRIVHGEQETNYCARCQAGGKVLADRLLSRLLKSSWPSHIDELG